MKLKFPTSQRLLPPLTLSEDEREHFAKMATRLVDDTMTEYVEYNNRNQIVRSQWKPVKKRENLTVYKETKSYRRRKSSAAASQSTPHSASGSNSSYTSSSEDASIPTATEWVMPKLLMVGTIVGTLDDVMYGLSTFDAPSMLLNTSYMGDEVIDAEFLSQILGPTEDEPYRFVGVKWIVKDNPPVVSTFVCPRDLLYLESKGIRTLPNGERVGHHLMHSLDLPGYGPLPGKSVLRGRVSSCILYRQLPNGTVDVYMTTNFEPNGNPGELVAVMSAANGLIYCWRSVLCAQHKKLAWLLRMNRTKQTPNGSVVKTHTSCGTCGKSQGTFRHLTECQLCFGPMCSRCRVDKKLSFTVGSGVKEIRQLGFHLCTTCVSSASHMNAFAIARAEVMSGRPDAGSTCTIDSEQTATSSMMTAFGRDTKYEEPDFDDDPLIENLVADSEDEEERSSRSKPRFTFESHPSVMGSPEFQPNSCVYEEGVETLSVVELNPLARTVSYPSSGPPVAPYPAGQEQLWRQMAQLNQAAESVYQYTKRTGETHLGTDSSAVKSGGGAPVRALMP